MRFKCTCSDGERSYGVKEQAAVFHQSGGMSSALSLGCSGPWQPKCCDSHLWDVFVQELAKARLSSNAGLQHQADIDPENKPPLVHGFPSILSLHLFI